MLFWFSSAVPIEGLHPLQWGIFRLKYRRERRSGLPLESPLAFYAKYAAQIVRKAIVIARRWQHLKRIVHKIEADPNAKSYTDGAMIPVAEEDSEHMELYTQNAAARSAVERELRGAGHKSIGERAHTHHGNGRATNGQAAGGHANGNSHGGNGHAGHDHLDHEHGETQQAAPPPA